MYYLATAYSADKENYKALIDEVAAFLISNGIFVFSTITHNHDIAEAMPEDIGRGWDFWGQYDRDMIDRMDGIIVLNNVEKHVKESIGVQAELEYYKGEEPIQWLDYYNDAYTPPKRPFKYDNKLIVLEYVNNSNTLESFNYGELKVKTRMNTDRLIEELAEMFPRNTFSITEGISCTNELYSKIDCLEFETNKDLIRKDMCNVKLQRTGE